jgi:DNA-binding CsgD family transcriptional regulator
MQGSWMRLSPHDFDLLQKAILDLYDYRNAAEFRTAAPRILLEVIRADDFSMMDCEVDLSSQALKITDAWEMQGRFSEPARLAALERSAWNHPFTQHMMKTGDPNALKFSDFFTMRQLRNTKFYDEAYRPAEVGRLLGALIVRGANTISTLNSIRGANDRDFSERDRLILSLLRPHFDLARRNAERVTACRGAKARALDAFCLTPREREIAFWMARGKTNLEISSILATRIRTVEKHIENILGKLGVENRTAAALIVAPADSA